MFQRTSRRTGGATTPASGSVTNAQLAPMAEGTVKMRAIGAGTGEPIDGNGLQLGQIIRIDTRVDDSSTSGTGSPYTVANETNWVRFTGLTGTYTVNGCDASAAGKTIIWHVEPGTSGVLVFTHNNAAVTTSQRFFCPAAQELQLRSGDSAVTIFTSNRHRVVSVSIATRPAQLAPVQSNLAIPFLVYVSCPSGGAAGTADDVTIWNAAAPFAMRIIDAQLRVSTAVGGSSAALRTASGGGGSVVLPDPAAATQTFSTAATGVLEDLATATATVALNGSLFLRRSDRSVVGELMLTCIRT